MIRTYVDAGVLIAAYRAAGPLAAPALAILGDPARQFVSSDFVRLEVLPKPTYFQRPLEIAFYDAFFAAVARSAVLRNALLQLALARAETFGLSAVDALHVAAAEATHADELVTTERATSPLSRVTSIRVISLHP